MKEVKAIGFDLFNTLITIEPPALKEAFGRLVHSLKQSGFILEEEQFRESHREAAVRHLEGCKQDGRETHNRFWISSALGRHGYEVIPNDSRIAEAVEAYFTAFYDYSRIGWSRFRQSRVVNSKRPCQSIQIESNDRKGENK